MFTATDSKQKISKVPKQMRDLPNWGVWKSTPPKGNSPKPGKLPQQLNGQVAKLDTPTHWTTFDLVADRSNKMFFFPLEPSGLVGVDVDDCIDEQGRFNELATAILEQFRGVAYAEISPSGTGFKLMTQAAKLPGAACSMNGVESYEKRRAWTVTENVIDGFDEIGDGQDAVTWLCETYLMPEVKQGASTTSTTTQAATNDVHRQVMQYLAKCGPAREGDRNNTAFRLAGHIAAFGVQERDVLDYVKSWNRGNAPALDDAELAQVVASALTNGTARPAKLVPEVSGSVETMVSKTPEWTAEGQEAAASVTKPISDYIKTLRTNLQSRELRTLYNCGAAFAGFEIGAGLLTALGAPPGRGKTALAMQLVFAAVENEPRLQRVVIAGNDTSPTTLLTREIVRLTRLRSDDVRFNTLTDIDRERALDGLDDIEARCGMVEILNPPDFMSLAALLESPPGLLLVDYLQLFAPAGDDLRKGVNDVMSLLRKLAMNGWAVLALSAVKRPASGVYSDKALDLSSFRESSEIEFQIDAGYVLKDIQPIEESRPWVRLVSLECVKNRHGATQSRDLVFDKAAMSFSLYNDGLDVDVDAICDNPFAEVSQ